MLLRDLEKMTTAITKERWDQAQEEELRLSSIDINPRYYEKMYFTMAKLMNINFDTDFVGKSIIEIGPGPLGVTLLTENFAKATIVEPLIYRWGQEYVDYYNQKNIIIETTPYEDLEIQEEVDETWFFNVLQHVIDPKLQLEKAKKTSKVVRIFEPINYPVELAHPHLLTKELFADVFGEDFGTFYDGGSIPDFHSSDCYYGTWVK
jgi:hypothetical protein